MAESLPSWITKAWERLYIRRNGGPPDRSFNVRNIQTPSLFGDVRIPKDLVPTPEASSLRDLSDEQLLQLLPQQGFAGFTTVDGYITTWHHEIDFQPPDGTIDESLFQPAAGHNAYEHGEGFMEHWWSLQNGDDQFVGIKVLRRTEDGTYRVHEIFSMTGDHYVYARNRPFDLPMAPSLEALVKETKPDREQLIALLDCELSKGSALGGRQPWEIQFSTLPYLPGKALAFIDQIVVDPTTGQLQPRDPKPDELWSFPVNTLDVEDLVVLFPTASFSTI